MKKKPQDSQHLEERYPSVNSHDIPPAPQTKMVNNSNAQEVTDRDPHTQVMTIETSARAQIQSSRQALMASTLNSTCNKKNMQRFCFVIGSFLLRVMYL